ncbi:MAG: hypothetical protein AB1426_06585 [Bacillota bacterium]
MENGTFINHLYALVLQDFPESLVMTLAVFSFINLRLCDKRILYVALLQSVTNLVRLLPIVFGIHTVILAVTLSIYTRIFTGVRLSRILAAVLVCIAIVTAMEMIYLEPLLNATKIPYETVFASPLLRAVFALPYELVLLLVALGKNHFNSKKGIGAELSLKS